jgi:transposase InsO family protein
LQFGGRIRTENLRDAAKHARSANPRRNRAIFNRPKTPRLNGKVERSHRVDEQEFYQLLDKDGIGDDIHLFNDKLREWEDYYNYHRPPAALDGQTPYERLLARKTSASVLPKS